MHPHTHTSTHSYTHTHTFTHKGVHGCKQRPRYHVKIYLQHIYIHTLMNTYYDMYSYIDDVHSSMYEYIYMCMHIFT